MFSTGCELLAERNPGLAHVFERVDAQFTAMGTAELIRPDDLASFLNIDPNQMRSALGMLAAEGVLNRVEMIECAHCQMATFASDYQTGMEEDGEYRCTSCDRPLTEKTIQAITGYRRGEKWPEVSNPPGDSGKASLGSTPVASTSGVALHERACAKQPCIFQKSKNSWALSFDGSTAHVANLAGMNYIAELLRNPRTPIEADALVAALRVSVGAADEVSEERIVGATAAMPGIPMTDAKAIRTVKAELRKRQSELKDALEDDEPAKAKLQTEISKLQNYLAQVKTRNGGSRTTGGIASRSRSRVKHAIDRAISRIADQHLPLANHLEHSIRTGNSLVYLPEEIPDWQF